MKKIICILSTMFAALLLMACNGLSVQRQQNGEWQPAYYEVQHI